MLFILKIKACLTYEIINNLFKVVGMEILLNSITPALAELSSDKNWRIRKQNIENLVYFAQQIVYIYILYLSFRKKKKKSMSRNDYQRHHIKFYIYISR